MTARVAILALNWASAGFVSLTAATAVTAAAVTFVSATVALPTWAVFIGWVATT